MGNPARGINGFTLIEILLAIAIITILAALIFPVFTKARAMARQAVCAGQLHQIGLAMAMYRSDFGELAPRLSSLFPDHLSDPRIFLCPEDPDEGKHDGDVYGYMEGDLHLPSGVSYTYLPNWRYAHDLGWWRPAPSYGKGKWRDTTPMAMCHWHWGKDRHWLKHLDDPDWGVKPKGWVLVLAAGGSVHRLRAELPPAEFSPPHYH